MAQTDGVGKIIVGFPAGGTLDQTGRRLAEAWRAQGRAYVVDNRPGAAGRIANGQLKRERADGSVVLCTQTSAMTIYPYVYANLSYDPVKDLRPVAQLASATCVLAISTAVPREVKSLADYVRWLKANEGGRSYASPAAGSLAQFLGFRFSQAAGVSMTHVAYRGSAPALQDLLGGQIPAYLGFVGDFLQYLDSGKIRLLAVTSDKRSRFLKEVPTFAEQGFGVVAGVESYGIFAPAATPEATLASLSGAVKEAARDKTLIGGLEQIGLEAAYVDAPEYAKFMAGERERWNPVVAASGFKADE